MLFITDDLRTDHVMSSVSHKVAYIDHLQSGFEESGKRRLRRPDNVDVCRLPQLTSSTGPPSHHRQLPTSTPSASSSSYPAAISGAADPARPRRQAVASRHDMLVLQLARVLGPADQRGDDEEQLVDREDKDVEDKRRRQQREGGQSGEFNMATGRRRRSNIDDVDQTNNPPPSSSSVIRSEDTASTSGRQRRDSPRPLSFGEAGSQAATLGTAPPVSDFPRIVWELRTPKSQSI